MNGDFYKKQSVKNDYLYNGKEMNTDLGLNWSDYGARFYDPVVGRFVSVDPWSDKYSNWSTYNYVEDNPLKFTDPTGKGPNPSISAFRSHNPLYTVAEGFRQTFSIIAKKVDNLFAQLTLKSSKTLKSIGVSGAATARLSLDSQTKYKAIFNASQWFDLRNRQSGGGFKLPKSTIEISNTTAVKLSYTTSIYGKIGGVNFKYSTQISEDLSTGDQQFTNTTSAILPPNKTFNAGIGLFYQETIADGQPKNSQTGISIEVSANAPSKTTISLTFKAGVESNSSGSGTTSSSSSESSSGSGSESSSGSSSEK